MKQNYNSNHRSLSVQVDFNYDADTSFSALGAMYQGAPASNPDEMSLAVRENLGKAWSRTIHSTDLNETGAYSFGGRGETNLKNWGFTRLHVSPTMSHPTAWDFNNKTPPHVFKNTPPFILSMTANTSLPAGQPAIFGWQVGKMWIAVLLAPRRPILSFLERTGLAGTIGGWWDQGKVACRMHNVLLPFPALQTGVAGIKGFGLTNLARADILLAPDAEEFFILGASFMKAGEKRENFFSFGNSILPYLPALEAVLDAKANDNFPNGYNMLAYVMTCFAEGGVLPFAAPQNPQRQATGHEVASDASANMSGYLPADLPSLPVGRSWVANSLGVVYVKENASGRVLLPYEAFDLTKTKSDDRAKIETLFRNQAALLEGMLYNYQVLGGLSNES